VKKPKLISPSPVQTGAVPIPYPPAVDLPEIGCGQNVATLDEFTGAMTPGAWDGSEETFPPEGTTSLDGGIYCIHGDVVFNAGVRVEGNGVLIVVADGEFLVRSGAEVMLSAANHGKAPGLLIYMPITNHKRVELNGGPDSSYTGTILAPGGDVRLNGMGSKHGFHSQIIGYIVEVDGQDVIPITYKDEENYDSFNMPEVLLVE
jgi:hypothetical protein